MSNVNGWHTEGKAMSEMGHVVTAVLGLHASHLRGMRRAGYMLALLMLGVLLIRFAPILPGLGGLVGYLPLHMLLETSSIVIAMLVFAVGWKAHRRGVSGNIFLAGCAFFVVAVLDFSHMLSFVGMPDFITASGPEKAIDFWLAARTVAVLTLLLVAVSPLRHNFTRLARSLIFAGALLLTGVLNWLILFHQELVPATYVTGQGLTPFKVHYEYALVALNLLTAAILWHQMRNALPFNAAGLFGTVCTMALSEFLFTLYVDVNDIYNLMGHVYKVAAYLFLYRAIFLEAFERPYDELQASQNQLQATLDALPDLLFELDAAGTYLDYHSPRVELLAQPVEQLLGRKLHDVLPVAAADICMLALREAGEAGHSHGREIELELHDGKHWFELSVSRKQNEVASSVSFIVLSRDITVRRKLEADLAGSNNLLKSVIDAAPMRIFWKDRELRYLGCNPAFAADAGVASPDNVIGKSDFELGWKDQAELYRADDRRVMDEGVPRLAYEEPQSTPDGRTIWLRTSKVRLQNAENNTVGVLGIYQDVTEQKQAELALLESENSLREAQIIASLGSYVLNFRTGLWRSSAVFDQLLGIDAAYQRTIANWNALIHPDDRARVVKYLTNSIAAKQKLSSSEFRIIRHDDHSERWVHGIGKMELDADGHPLSLQGTIQDVTERKRGEDALGKLSLAVQQSPNSIVITDLDARIEYVNEAFSRVTGYSPEEVLGRNPRLQQSGKTPQAIYQAMWAQLTCGQPWRGELTNRRKDGSEYIESAVISPVRQADGRITGYLAVKTDITEAKRTEARIERLAHFDQLTDLPNRTLLNERFKLALSQTQRNNQQLALMFLDLDRFKNINDTLGHDVGDKLLLEVAARIKAVLREEDTVSRLGGDEFVLLFPNTDAHGAAHVAGKLLIAVSQPCVIEYHELTSTPSIGIAIYPDDGKDLETLSKNADAAMYRVKQEGRNNFRFFTPEMQAYSVRNLQVVNALRNALNKNELFLHYQPQISIQDGQVIGAEALLRWQHPEWGMISPAEFIPIAEDSGQIIPIGEWVLRTAVRQLKTWLAAGLPQLVMAVNLSAVQFHQSNIVELVTGILDEAGLPHHLLELELTEAVAMHKPEAAIAVMDKLHESGIRLSIDDFGTGYSSLSYLKKFKLYKLKIDQSFVRDLTDDPEDKAIVGAIISMAGSLGIHTIAEGVETSGQLSYLRLQGCDEVQGYYFSKPLPPVQFEAFVRQGEG
ncbi:MAG: EAL domain-containing protein [Gallionella sp.]|nr:EAL domain-containing protein [Gallionella sp.]